MSLLPSLFRRIGTRVRLGRDLLVARRSFIRSPDSSPEERALLREVSLRVHPDDTMYDGADHYVSVGLSGLRCVQEAI